MLRDQPFDGSCLLMPLLGVGSFVLFGLLLWLGLSPNPGLPVVGALFLVKSMSSSGS